MDNEKTNKKIETDQKNEDETPQIITPDTIITMFEASDTWLRLEYFLGGKRAKVWRFVLLMYLLSKVKWLLNYSDHIFEYVVDKGIKLYRVDRIEPIEDGFRIIMDVHIKDLDFAKVRKKWRVIYKKSKILDPRVYKSLDPAFKRALKTTFWELEQIDQFDETQEYKVVKEETVNEGENK
jgi:hypothetical protein